jgi:hypothetical protein
MLSCPLLGLIECWWRCSCITFSSPFFHLLYLLSLHNYPNSSSSYVIPSSFLCILRPSLPSSFLHSLISSDYPLVIPSFLYVHEAPWLSDSIVITHLSHNNIFISVPNDFMNLSHRPLKKSLFATLYVIWKWSFKWLWLSLCMRYFTI